MTTHLPDKVAAAPPERLITSIIMAVVAVAINGVKPGHEEVHSNLRRFDDPYFRAFLSQCMQRVYGRRTGSEF